MTNQQYATAILALKKNQNSHIDKVLTSTIERFHISQNEIDSVKENILNDFNNGVKNLNNNQFENLLEMIADNELSDNDIINKLNFYEIRLENQDSIMKFLKAYSHISKPLKVQELDGNFKGVQVATTDDFNKLISQGYSGDWTMDPKNKNLKKLQIASMNETGSFPRGYFINADIESFEAILDGKKTKYIIHFSNPIIINSGNKNIKFNNNPVKYIN